MQIVLENTLREFFDHEDAITDSSLITPKRVFLSYNPTSDPTSTTSFLHNAKYLVQQWRGSNTNNYSPIFNLVLMPQRMAWMIGDMPVIFMKHGEENGQQISKKVEEDLAETTRVIAPRSRFDSVFFSSLDEIRTRIGVDSVIIPFLPADFIAAVPHHNIPDVHYELLSKRGLALSGLPTPKVQLIDFNLPKGCRGWNAKDIDQEVAHAITTIHQHKLPFVLKTNSAGGSKGTYLIRNSDELAVAEEKIRFHLSIELRSLKQDNTHLHPCSLVLTEFLPGQASSINFYVRKNGQAQFSSICKQIMSESGMWLGGMIHYSRQEQESLEFGDIMQKTATLLCSRGYQGPVGIDIMTDSAGNHNVVDLNPRPTGSFVLGCLRRHFERELDMDTACVLPFMQFSGTREDFNAKFEAWLARGEIIVLSWFSDPTALQCHMCLAVGGKNEEMLGRLCDSINDWVTENSSED